MSLVNVAYVPLLTWANSKLNSLEEQALVPMLGEEPVELGTIISTRSPYDRYRWGGDASAISNAAKRGDILFFSGERGGCFQCHGGWNFGGRMP